jgi:hypothetical protein
VHIIEEIDIGDLEPASSSYQVISLRPGAYLYHPHVKAVVIFSPAG